MKNQALIVVPLWIALGVVTTVHPGCAREGHPEQYQNLPVATVATDTIVWTSTATATLIQAVPPQYE